MAFMLSWILISEQKIPGWQFYFSVPGRVLYCF